MAINRLSVCSPQLIFVNIDIGFLIVVLLRRVYFDYLIGERYCKYPFPRRLNWTRLCGKIFGPLKFDGRYSSVSNLTRLLTISGGQF